MSQFFRGLANESTSERADGEYRGAERNIESK